DCRGSRWMARESSRLPTSARPKVSSRPVESAMQNDANCRFAVRMNRAPSVWEEDMNAEIVARPFHPSTGSGCPERAAFALGALRRRKVQCYAELPVCRPPRALQIAEPFGRIRQCQLACRPLL